MTRQIVVATRNSGKIREIRAILDDPNLELLSLEDISFLEELVENGNTYLENARIKSSRVAGVCGKITLADDSGIEIDALQGRPGVESARFGGEDLDSPARNALLLELLKAVPWEERTARFRCIITIHYPGGKEYACEGVCEGAIAQAPKGTRGFGYDPIFFLPRYGKTMAELSPEEKNKISHRAEALRKAREILKISYPRQAACLPQAGNQSVTTKNTKNPQRTQRKNFAILAPPLRALR